jgi:hypothetical protein
MGCSVLTSEGRPGCCTLQEGKEGCCHCNLAAPRVKLCSMTCTEMQCRPALGLVILPAASLTQLVEHDPDAMAALGHSACTHSAFMGQSTRSQACWPSVGVGTTVARQSGYQQCSNYTCQNACPVTIHFSIGAIQVSARALVKLHNHSLYTLLQLVQGACSETRQLGLQPEQAICISGQPYAHTMVDATDSLPSCKQSLHTSNS